MSKEKVSFIKSQVEGFMSVKANLQTTLDGVQEQVVELQEKCSHPNKKSQSEYDTYNYECPDCKKTWSERR